MEQPISITNLKPAGGRGSGGVPQFSPGGVGRGYRLARREVTHGEPDLDNRSQKPAEAGGLGVSPSLPLRGVWWGYRLVRREVAYG